MPAYYHKRCQTQSFFLFLCRSSSSMNSIRIIILLFSTLARKHCQLRVLFFISISSSSSPSPGTVVNLKHYRSWIISPSGYVPNSESSSLSSFYTVLTSTSLTSLLSSPSPGTVVNLKHYRSWIISPSGLSSVTRPSFLLLS